MEDKLIRQLQEEDLFPNADERELKRRATSQREQLSKLRDSFKEGDIVHLTGAERTLLGEFAKVMHIDRNVDVIDELSIRIAILNDDLTCDEGENISVGPEEIEKTDKNIIIAKMEEKIEILQNTIRTLKTRA